MTSWPGPPQMDEGTRSGRWQGRKSRSSCRKDAKVRLREERGVYNKVARRIISKATVGTSLRCAYRIHLP